MAPILFLLLAQDYFPLQTGNQWLYRSSRAGQTLTVEVGESAQFGANVYYRVTGFATHARWLRRTAEGAILEWDNSAEKPFLALQSPEGEKFAVSVDQCTKSAIVHSRKASAKAPAGGSFDAVLELRYTDTVCADAGLVSDLFAPDIGLVARQETSLLGPVNYELVYARINGFIALTQPETGFSLSTPSPILENGRIFARMTLRTATPLTLRFASSQIFNLELTTEAGDLVYSWASDKLFLAVLQDLLIEGEKNWVVEFAAPGPAGLKAGRYHLEAFLTTMGSQPYRAKVRLDVIKP